MTRSAISPRFATKMRLNMISRGGIHEEQRLTKLDRLLVFDQDLDDRAGTFRRYLVEKLHGLDETNDRGWGNARAHLDEGFRARLWRRIKSANQRTLDLLVVLGG